MSRPHISHFKTEFQAGVSIFLSIWTITFLYSQIMSPIPESSSQWFIKTCLLLFTGSLISAFVFKKPYVIGPGMSIGWFASHQILNQGPLINFFICIPIVGVILILISHFKIIKNADKLLPSYLQESISIGIGLLFLKIALQNQWHQNLLSYSNGYFILSIILLLTFKFKQISWGLLYTVLIVVLISYALEIKTIEHWFTIPAMPKTIIDFNLANLNGKILFSQVLALSLFSFFDTATGVFCLQEIQKLLHLPYTSKELSKGYLGVGINNLVSGFLCVGPNTIFIESAVGLQIGSKKPMSLLIVALCFIMFIFCSSLEQIVPQELFKGILFFIGLTLMTPLYYLRKKNILEIFFSIIIIAIMIYTQSILDGFIIGLIINYVFHWYQKKPINPLMHLVTFLGCISLYFV